MARCVSIWQYIFMRLNISVISMFKHSHPVGMWGRLQVTPKDKLFASCVLLIFFNPERPYSGYATDTYCLSLLVVDLSVGALPCLQLSFAATPAYDILGLLGPLACNFSSVRNMNEMPASSWIVCPRTEVQIGILKHYSPIVRCRHGKCDMALDHGLTIREVNMFERVDGPAYRGLSKLQSELKRPLAAGSMAQWQTSLILWNSTVGLRMNSFLLHITRRFFFTMLLQKNWCRRWK